MAKNTHMTHSEDSVIYGGIEIVLEQLKIIGDTLAGNSNTSHSITVKWDGAPAIICGRHPAINNGEFFVGTKGVFNKTPKFYPQDEYEGELAEKVKLAYEYLSQVEMKGIFQGDMMFTRESKNIEVIDGQKYVTFHPNTIAYAAPINSDLGKRILKAEFGIVFHTRYTGEDLESMKASYNVDVNEFKAPSNVWLEDASVKDFSGVVNMTERETAFFNRVMDSAIKIYESMNKNDLAFVQESIGALMEIYNNSLIRSGNDRPSFDGLMSFIEARYQKEIDKKKSEKGKQDTLNKLETLRNGILPKKNTIKSMFRLMETLVVAKNIIIRKLNAMAKLKTFVLTKDGFENTSEEGYVAIDNVNNHAYKLVDRLEFSSKNFNPNFIKGWQRKAMSESINEDLTEESNLVIVYPGRFQPAGPHHVKVFRSIEKAFPNAKCYISTSDKVEPGSPFNFEEKKSILMALGIDENKIIEAKKGTYNVLSYSHIVGFDDYLMFVVGDKDYDRFAFEPGKMKTTKSGKLAVIQAYEPKDTQKTSAEHAYVFLTPTIQSDGQQAASASAFRKTFIQLDEKGKRALMQKMGYPEILFDLFNSKISRNMALKKD